MDAKSRYVESSFYLFYVPILHITLLSHTDSVIEQLAYLDPPVNK